MLMATCLGEWETDTCEMCAPFESSAQLVFLALKHVLQ